MPYRVQVVFNDFMQANAQAQLNGISISNSRAGSETSILAHRIAGATSEARSEPTSKSQVSLPALSDEDLLRRCAQGDEDAMQELVRRYQGTVHRFLARYLDPTEDGEQATLNVFVKAWQNAGSFQFRASVSTWLFRIAINLAQDMHKHRRAQPQEQPWPEEHQLGRYAIGNALEEAHSRLEDQDRSELVQNALRQLRADDRLLLVLYYFEERSYEEMQAITSLSNTVLKMRLTRARRRLRSVLSGAKGTDE